MHINIILLNTNSLYYSLRKHILIFSFPKIQINYFNWSQYLRSTLTSSALGKPLPVITLPAVA